MSSFRKQFAITADDVTADDVTADDVMLRSPEVANKRAQCACVCPSTLVGNWS